MSSRQNPGSADEGVNDPASVELEPTESPAFRRGYAVVVAVVVVVSLMKGLRLPNLYSATHFAFNYDYGFVRRGLIGQIARSILGEAAHKYWSFVAVSFLVLLAGLALLGWAFRRALRRNPSDLGLKAVLLVFAASPALVFNVHLIGYLDHFGLVLVLALLLWLTARPRSRYAVYPPVIALGVFLVFVHEASVVMFGPVLVFMMIAHILTVTPTGSLRDRKALLHFAQAALATLLIFSASLAVSSLGADLGSIVGLRRELARSLDYPIRPDAFVALVNSSTYNLRELMPSYWADAWSRKKVVIGGASFGPSLLFVIVYGFVAIQRLDMTPLRRRILWALLLAAAISPLTLNLVGWDTSRWYAIAVFAATLCVLALKLFFPSNSVHRASPGLLTAGVLAFTLSLSADILLFDGVPVQFYPFERQFDFIHHLSKAGFKYRPPE